MKNIELYSINIRYKHNCTVTICKYFCERERLKLTCVIVDNIQFHNIF